MFASTDMSQPRCLFRSSLLALFSLSISGRSSSAIALNRCPYLVMLIRGFRSFKDYSFSPMPTSAPVVPTLFQHPQPLFSNSTVIPPVGPFSLPSATWSRHPTGSPGFGARGLLKEMGLFSAS